MSAQVNPPTLGAQTTIYLAKITDFPIPKSGQPTVGSYVEIGCTRDVNITLPSQPVHQISCGLNPSEWTVPGKKTMGSLEINALDFADVPTDILDFNLYRCVAKLVTEDQEGTEVRTLYAIDWSPEIRINFPDGDGETTVSASGAYNRAIVSFA